MPQPVVFAACEKIIVEQGTNNISLISLLQDLTAHLPPNAEGEVKTAQSWSVFCLWQRDSEADAEHSFEQRVVLVDPKGVAVFEMMQAFRMQARTQRNVGLVNGFPISLAGEYQLVLSLRVNGGEWKHCGTYILTLKHAPAG